MNEKAQSTYSVQGKSVSDTAQGTQTGAKHGSGNGKNGITKKVG